MSGIFQRISMIFRAKTDKALDKLEDPRQTLDYSYQRQLELLQKVRRGVADVATSRKRIELQANQLNTQADKLTNQAQKALEVGRFRLSSGQVSYRMYDRYSLKQLFLAAGFADVVPRTATESGYARWNVVNLDVAPDGRVARPHALILEGTRQ